jgi:polysaccharide biosynthesis protein PslH
MSTPARSTVVAITSQIPWPLDRGGHLRTFHLLRALATHFRVVLVTSSSRDEREAIEALGDVGIAVRMATLPAPNVVRTGFQIGESAVRRQPFVLYRRHWHKETAAMLDATIAEEQPDIVYLDHLDSALYRPVSGSARVVLDLHNVYSTLVERLASDQRSAARRAFLHREARLLAEVERRSVREADLVFAVSEADAEHFVGIGARHLELVPNGVDCSAYEALPTGRSASAAPVILYTGALSWEPNAEAARFLAQSVLPEVRRTLPEATLAVVGRTPSPEVTALGQLPGVTVHGDVPSLIPYLEQAHIMAVPLSSGGGTRLKILEAFAAGVPVVSTAIGCEGLQASSGRELLVAERDVFAQELVSVLTDGSRAERLAQNGRTLARATYDWQVVGHHASTAVERLSKRPAAAISVSGESVFIGQSH